MKVTELEVGKVYTRNKLGILFRKKDNGFIEYTYGEEPWECSGIQYNEAIDSDFTEYEEPTDWSKVEIDTKILVKDYVTDDWKKRHFADVKDGIVRTFSNGKTSFSNGNLIFKHWKYAKLYKETNDEK